MHVDQGSDYNTPDKKEFYTPEQEKKADTASSDDYLKQMIASVRPWLDKIDKIREVLGTTHELPISLPTIVVIGD